MSHSFEYYRIDTSNPEFTIIYKVLETKTGSLVFATQIVNQTLENLNLGEPVNLRINYNQHLELYVITTERKNGSFQQTDMKYELFVAIMII